MPLRCVLAGGSVCGAPTGGDGAVMPCVYCNTQLGDGEFVAHAECVVEDTKRRNAGMCVGCGRNDARGSGDLGAWCAGCGGAPPKYSGYPGSGGEPAAPRGAGAGR